MRIFTINASDSGNGGASRVALDIMLNQAVAIHEILLLKLKVTTIWTCKLIFLAIVISI